MKYDKTYLRKLLNKHLTSESVWPDGGYCWGSDEKLRLYYRKELVFEEDAIELGEMESFLKRDIIAYLMKGCKEKEPSILEVIEHIEEIESRTNDLCYDPNKKFTRKQMDEAVEKLFKDNPEDTEMLKKVMLALKNH